MPEQPCQNCIKVEKYLKAALIGGGIGFVIGGAYGVFFVAYRDALAAKRNQAEKESGVTIAEATIPEELPARARIAEAMKERTARAKEIREAEPSLSWPEAMRRAARNGAPAEEEPVQQEEPHVE